MCVHASNRLAITVAASLAAVLQLSAVRAGEPPAKAEITITIFAHHYVVERRVIDDLDVLEKTVGSAGPRTVRLHACGAAADRAQRAAAHRFRSSNLELRLVGPHDASCQARPALRETAARAAPDRGPFNIDDRVVDQWWHASMP